MDRGGRSRNGLRHSGGLGGSGGPLRADGAGEERGLIVVGRQGLRVFPAETAARQSLFEFMASPVSSEKPKGVTVREVAQAIKRTRAAGEKVLAVLGPAVVHTGSAEHVCRLVRAGYLNVLFAGNALA